MNGGAFDSFLAKWRLLEPEMQFAEPFVPPVLLARFRAWGTLLAELESSTFAVSEAHLASTRLGWWVEELQRPSPQHPAACALQQSSDEGARACAAAAGVALAALGLTQQEETAADTSAAVALLQGYGAAVARTESALFGGPPPAGAQEAPHAVAVGTLARWAPRLEERPLVRERLPLNLLARHAAGQANAAGAARRAALVRDLAVELQALSPPAGRLPLYRAVRWAFDRARLARLAGGALPRPGQPVPPPWRATLTAWRAARRARS